VLPTENGCREVNVVTFRPTRIQAAGHGGFVGGVIGATAGLVLLILSAVGMAGRLSGWLAALLLLATGLVVGAATGVVFGRDEGADIDHHGIHPVPREPGVFAPWQHVEDLRAERRGGRTRVTVCFDTGHVSRLPAPYDGHLLGRDPQFERKLFMLRHLWETHRSFRLSRSRRPA
jgi:hypothetical protein